MNTSDKKHLWFKYLKNNRFFIDKILSCLALATTIILFVIDRSSHFIYDPKTQEGLDILICIQVVGCFSLFFTILSFVWDNKFKVTEEKITNSILSEVKANRKELGENSTREHEQIKRTIEIYKTIEKLNFVVNFENEYISTQNKQGVEMWIISNSVAEPNEVIKKIFNNLLKGVKYYYIIPNTNSCLKDIINTAKLLQEMDKKDELNKQNFVYIQDDLFDLMPTDLVDILFYCNPNSTDYTTNMSVFYSLQDMPDNDTKEKDIYYNLANLKEQEIRRYFEIMSVWKQREWKQIL